MTVKVAVVGGGSTYTPEMVEGFVRYGERLPVTDIVLCDPDAGRVGVVAGLARRVLAAHGWGGRLTTTADVDAAVEGADFVVVQLRVGGQAARLDDERLPLEAGCIGQETTGAGGFAKAMRTVPVVLDVAERVARLAPGAWLVDFTNPVGIVMQALVDEGHRAIGLCNVAIGLQRRFAELLGVAPDAVQLGHVGLNHFTWERAALVDGVDRLPELLAGHRDALADELRLPAEVLDLYGAVPSYYLRWFLEHGRVLREQQAGGELRAAAVQRIEAELLELYRDESLTVVPEQLMQRGGAYYSEAAVQLMASLHDGRGDVQVVDVRNDGAVPGLAVDDVVEIPARIDRDGAHVLPVDPLPPEILGPVQHVKAYERLAARAAVTGSRDDALRALVTHPLIGEWDRAVTVLDRLAAGSGGLGRMRA